MLNKKAKTMLLIFTILAVAALLLRTQIAGRTTEEEEFRITENPVVTFDNALAAESSVFIMFYSEL